MNDCLNQLNEIEKVTGPLLLPKRLKVQQYTLRLRRGLFVHNAHHIGSQTYWEKNKMFKDFIKGRVKSLDEFPDTEVNWLTPLYFFTTTDREYKSGHDKGHIAYREDSLNTNVNLNYNTQKIVYVGKTIGANRFARHDTIRKLTNPTFGGTAKVIWLAQIWIRLHFPPKIQNLYNPERQGMNLMKREIDIPVEWLAPKATVENVVNFLESQLIYYFSKSGEPFMNSSNIKTPGKRHFPRNISSPPKGVHIISDIKNKRFKYEGVTLLI